MDRDHHLIESQTGEKRAHLPEPQPVPSALVPSLFAPTENREKRVLPPPGMWDVWSEVRAERERAHEIHGDTSMESSPADDPVGRRLRVLVEEVGEVAKEFNDAEHEGRPVDIAAIRKELIQVAAMAGAWADACSDFGGNSSINKKGE